MIKFASFSSFNMSSTSTNKKMAVGKAGNELQHKQTFQLSWKQEFIGVADDQTPTIYFAVYWKFESNLNRKDLFFRSM